MIAAPPDTRATSMRFFSEDILPSKWIRMLCVQVSFLMAKAKCIKLISDAVNTVNICKKATAVPPKEDFSVHWKDYRKEI